MIKSTALSGGLWGAVAAFVLLLPRAADAQVYKWEDGSGVIHYSNKAPRAGLKPVQLPPITRGEVKLSQRKLETCDKHGGINCQLGPDTDGSVICYDGFRGAVSRYRFSCTAPKLEVADVSDLKDDGSFSVFVRNSKSVTAREPEVFFKQPEGREVKLKGPTTVEAFGLAEFVYQSAGRPVITQKPTIEHLSLACANCP